MAYVDLVSVFHAEASACGWHVYETAVVHDACAVGTAVAEEAELRCGGIEFDVGVGSGAIALAIADEHPGADLVGVDSSEAALALAEQNRARIGVDGRVRLVHGDLLRGVEGRFDLVVSNPPYVGAEEWERLQPEIRLYEPRAALVGTGVAEAIARDAQPLLVAGGGLVLEAGDGQAAALAATLEELGYEDVAITRDLAGRDRVVEGRRA